MMSQKDLIFISFSKRFTGEVAAVIEQTLNTVFSDSNVEAFLSSTGVNAGNFQDQIDSKMKKAKFAISILSPENKYNSPWLMYEAGALSLSARQNGGELLPYLFCRHISEIEKPLMQLQVKQYQIHDSSNKEQFKDIFIEINKKLSQENQISDFDIENTINRRWDDINNRLQDIANRIENGANLSENEDMTTASNENGALGLGSISDSLKTRDQKSIRLIDDFSASTPLEIEDHFERMLGNFAIPKHWQVQNVLDKKYNATRVIVNNTRFSTYVAFTDGERIIFFDRKKGVKKTNVFNQRYDVFGSVQFENRTIKMKIENEKFLNAKIVRIEEIAGVAIEDNRNKTGPEVETAVMFGICVYMEQEDLDLAKEKAEDIEIFPVDKVLINLGEKSLTSKAQLSVQHIIRNRAT